MTSPSCPGGRVRRPSGRRPDPPATRVVAVRRITTSSLALSAAELAERVGHPASLPRLTPLQSGQAAVARHDVHIERVWPMRSPSTGELGGSSSASSRSERRGAPPARIVPVEGLRMSQAFPHEPVMAAEVVDLLGDVPAGLVLDATLGGAGHARGPPRGAPRHHACSGIDRDPIAVAAATGELAVFGGRAVDPPVPVRLARPRWSARCRTSWAPPTTERGLTGVLFDLGVSSPQLDVAERGFSYRRDAPLDMRMDPTVGRTGADVVNELRRGHPGRTVRRQRRDPLRPPHRPGHHRRPSRSPPRASWPTWSAPPSPPPPGAPAATRPGGCSRPSGSPSTRSSTSSTPGSTPPSALLRPGGRCVVISYHSGEDRLVKATFTRAATDDCQCPPGLPCVCGADPQFRLVPPRLARGRPTRRSPATAGPRPPACGSSSACRDRGRRQQQRGGGLMAPPASGTARRAAAAPVRARPTRRPPLRRLRARSRGGRRRRSCPAAGTVAGRRCWSSASLLVVVVGDTMVAQGQVRLADIQIADRRPAAAQKSMQVDVAQLAAPDRVVAEALALGHGGSALGRGPPPGPARTFRFPVPDTAPPACAVHRDGGRDVRPVSPAVLLRRRSRAIRLLVVAVFLVLVLRLVQVQEFGHQHYAALSKAQLTETVTVPADPRRHLRPERRGPGRDGDPPDRGGRPADHQGPGVGGRRPVARARACRRPRSGRN